jgi:Tol biopolymer transport system component
MLILDRNGKETGSIGEVSEQGYPRFSPNGRQLSFYYFDPRRRVQNIWLYDITSRTRSRFTSGIGGSFVSVWSPDGKSIAYNSPGSVAQDLWRKTVGGREKETLLFESTEGKYQLDWSRDGRYILLGSDGVTRTKGDLWVLPLSVDQKPFPFLKTEFVEENARFSPDGKWVVYDTDEPGSVEVYVRPFPGPGPASRISTAGGYFPLWTSGGRQITYVRDDNRVIAADLRFRGNSVEVTSSREMFTMPTFFQSYDISPDGSKFVVGRWLESGESTPVTLVLNWMDLARKK